MRVRRLQAQLRRYRDRRDPRAIGRLFDAVAPELLSVAGHVADSPAEAEDLVQATFLTALEHPERHDSERPVVPWLIGILTREARYWHRQSARRLDPERLLEEKATREVNERPDARTSATELESSVDAALERLPELYRDVLTRHLQQGHTPADIARELGRSGASVRVQLHRGLAQLRALLPAGLSAGLVIGLAPRGLSRVRDELLTHVSSLPAATAAGGTTAFSLSLGGLVVTKKSLLAAAAVGVAGWLVFSNIGSGTAGPDRGVDGEPGPIAPAGEEVAAISEPAHSLGQATPAGEGSRAPIDVEPPETVTVDRLLVKTRFADGRRAPRVGFELHLFDAAGQSVENLLERTGDDGEVLLSGLAPGEYGLYGDRGGHATAQVVVKERSGSPTREELDALTSVVTLTVPRGQDITGRVVDTYDRGVAGATIWVTTSLSRRSFNETTRTDERGYFELEQLSNDCFFGAHAAGHQPSRPLWVEQLEREGAGFDVELRLPGVGTAVRGYVRDPDGDPIAAARVRVGPQDLMNLLGSSGVEGPPPPLELRTDDQGYFAAEGIVPGEVRLAVSAAGWPVWFGSTTSPEGSSSHVDISLEHGAWVSGRLTDPDGAPVESVLVETAPLREEGAGIDASSFTRLQNMTDADGRFRLGPLTPGLVELHARVSGGAETASGSFVAVAGQEHECNLSLEGLPSIRGTARAADGSPLANWTVLSRPEGDSGPPMNAVRTDADGHFQIDLARAGSVCIELYSPDVPRPCAPQTSLAGVTTGTRGLELFLDPEQQPTGRVTGELMAPSGAPHAPVTLQVWLEGFGLVGVRVVAAGEGRFAIDSLPAGELSLTFDDADHERVEIAVFELAVGEERDLGLVRLEVPAAPGIPIPDGD